METLNQIELVMASIPWRAEALNGILNAARKQGIEHVALVLDKYTKEDEAKLDLSGFQSLRIKRLSKNSLYRGQGYRYFMLCSSHFPVTVLLDDDQIVGEKFFHETLETLSGPGEKIDGIAWAGQKIDGSRWIRISEQLDRNEELFFAQANSLMFRTTSIRDFLYDNKFKYLWREAFTGTRRGETDEILFNCWLRCNNKKIVRPAGLADIAFIEKLAQDSRTIGMRAGMPSWQNFFTMKLQRKMNWYTPIGNFSNHPWWWPCWRRGPAPKII